MTTKARVKLLGFEEQVPVEKLLPAPYNPRRIDPVHFERLKTQLREHGVVDPIVARRSDGLVIGGHQRLQAEQALGHAAVPVRWVECDDRTAKALNVALNNPRLAGEFEDQGLAAILEELKGVGEEELTGYDLGEVDRIIAEAKGTRAGLTDPNAIPAPPLEAKTKRGDLYRMGEHRLLCGDSASMPDLERLLGGDRVHLLNTDPPFNVKVDPRSLSAVASGQSGSRYLRRRELGKALAKMEKDGRSSIRRRQAKDSALRNDFIPADKFEELLRSWFGNASRVLEPGRSFYVWGGYSNVTNYPPAIVSAGLFLAQVIVWVKKHPVLTRKDFMGNHESCFYGWKEGAAHYFDPRVKNAADVIEDVDDFCALKWLEEQAHEAVPHEATDVWAVKKISPQLMLHLTEKPVELALRALQFSSRPGEVVLDLFGGAGGTLIAAEQVGRKARLVELDPLYSDVIVKRWEEFTGQKAEVEHVA